MNEAFKERRLLLDGPYFQAFDRRNKRHAISISERRKAKADRRKAYEALNTNNTADDATLTTTSSPIDISNELADFNQLQQALQSTQVELQRALDRYHILYERSPLSYVTLTNAGFIANINSKAAKLLAYKHDPLHLTSFTAFVNPSEIEAWQALLSTISQDELRQIGNLKLVTTAGEAFEARLDCMRQIMDRETTTILVAITDLSAQPPKDSLGVSACAFDIEEGIMVTDPQMTILQVNRAFTRITGYESEEAIGLTPHLLHYGLQNKDFYQTLWEVIELQGYWQGEILNRHKNGEIYLEWFTISAIKNPEGQVINYIGSFLKSNSNKQIESERLIIHQQLEQQLQQKNAEIQIIQAELNDINTALKVMVEHQNAKYSDVQEDLEHDIQQEIMPLLFQLRKSNSDARQLDLLQILDANLQNLVSSYGRSHSMARIFQELTPKEIQVASMIREGFSTKHIASTLSASTETVNVHRKNIRKKLGLDNKSINLRTFLNSFK